MFLRERHVRIDEAYKAFCRARPCTFCGTHGAEPSDPHHLVPRRWREPSRDDYTCVPACRRCHDQVGNLGLTRMLERHGMTEKDLVLVAVDLLVDFFQPGRGESAAF